MKIRTGDTVTKLSAIWSKSRNVRVVRLKHPRHPSTHPPRPAPYTERERTKLRMIAMVIAIMVMVMGISEMDGRDRIGREKCRFELRFIILVEWILINYMQSIYYITISVPSPRGSARGKTISVKFFLA